MADPAEGLDADGHITTGVARAHLQAPFREVVDAAVDGCRARCRGAYGLYVFGSAVTGMAVVGTSDLDLLLVVDAPDDIDRVSGLGKELSQRSGDVVREVGLATTTRAAVFADTDDGLAWRCFLKHYCVCVDGVDVTGELPRCRPSRALVRGFAADTSRVMEHVRSCLADGDSDEVRRLARAAARKLLLTCAAIASTETGTWTTDRERGAALLAARHPERAGELQRAVAWSDPRQRPDPTADEVTRFLDGFGAWVVDRLEAVVGDDRPGWTT